ncbi:hypothetical protein OH799_32025 [Nocardia sp. NBC_00881]|uniref:hypothetical protein n=1 Tax=Nocardia sp. NBC_00881 TaxID=2975995 RepID=UPI0038636FE0|nr:hypothetical protein OH799_32025 [Nocardia sp. NBC_00881]
MRFVNTGAIALAFACSTIIGAGAAHADQSVTVSADLLDCAIDSGVDVDADAVLTAGNGGKITVSDEVYTQLQAEGCLSEPS